NTLASRIASSTQRPGPDSVQLWTPWPLPAGDTRGDNGRDEEEAAARLRPPGLSQLGGGGAQGRGVPEEAEDLLARGSGRRRAIRPGRGGAALRALRGGQGGRGRHDGRR